MLEEGLTAPEFSLLDQTGTEVTLSQYKGQWVVLYFYPKDNTPGCTAEACGIRDMWSDFEKSEITVLGVSADSVRKHQNFIKKNNLPFTLLSDPEKQMIQQYGAWGEKMLFGKKYMGIFRISYLIDPQGKIRKVYPKVDPEAHAQEILEDVKGMQ